jgi:NADH:ubiquinone oxidoreductase subunit
MGRMATSVRKSRGRKVQPSAARSGDGAEVPADVHTHVRKVRGDVRPAKVSQRSRKKSRKHLRNSAPSPVAAESKGSLAGRVFDANEAPKFSKAQLARWNKRYPKHPDIFKLLEESHRLRKEYPAHSHLDEQQDKTLRHPWIAKSHVGSLPGPEPAVEDVLAYRQVFDSAAEMNELASLKVRIEELSKPAPTLEDQQRWQQTYIADECDRIKVMLLEKNLAYGSSFSHPLRIFSKACSEEQILVRIDDKLSRLSRGSNAGEDVVLDLIGYLVLLRVTRKHTPVTGP